MIKSWAFFLVFDCRIKAIKATVMRELDLLVKFRLKYSFAGRIFDFRSYWTKHSKLCDASAWCDYKASNKESSWRRNYLIDYQFDKLLTTAKQFCERFGKTSCFVKARWTLLDTVPIWLVDNHIVVTQFLEGKRIHVSLANDI